MAKPNAGICLYLPTGDETGIVVAFSERVMFLALTL